MSFFASPRPTQPSGPVSRRNLLKFAALMVPAGAALAWAPSASAQAPDIELIDAVSYSLESEMVAFAPGTTRPRGALEPGGANVGPRVPLTRYDGDITIQAGQVVSGLDIYGRVTFAGAGVLRDCVVRGWRSDQYAALTSPVGIVSGKSFDLKGGLIEWCRIDATGRESLWANGISGGNYTARYCEITRVNDGISGVQVGNATVECCRIWNGTTRPGSTRRRTPRSRVGRRRRRTIEPMVMLSRSTTTTDGSSEGATSAAARWWQAPPP